MGVRQKKLYEILNENERRRLLGQKLNIKHDNPWAIDSSIKEKRTKMVKIIKTFFCDFKLIQLGWDNESAVDSIYNELSSQFYQLLLTNYKFKDAVDKKETELKAILDSSEPTFIDILKDKTHPLSKRLKLSQKKEEKLYLTYHESVEKIKGFLKKNKDLLYVIEAIGYLLKTPEKMSTNREIAKLLKFRYRKGKIDKICQILEKKGVITKVVRKHIKKWVFTTMGMIIFMERSNLLPEKEKQLLVDRISTLSGD